MASVGHGHRRTARPAQTLDVDDLADPIEQLPDHLADVVRQSMDRENRERVEQVLSYPEATAGRLMKLEFVTVRGSAAIGGAMVANPVLAALVGVLVPVLLDRGGVDPAIACSVVVTIVSDVMGFFAFLGLGTFRLLQ